MIVDLLRKVEAAPDLRGRRSVRSARHASRLPERGAHGLPARARTTTGISDCEVWLYRGAWQEWGPHEIEMAVPLSPSEVDRKRTAIFKHQSQKDRALFPGPDMREFWQAGRGPQPRHGRALRQAGPGRVRSDRRLRALARAIAKCCGKSRSSECSEPESCILALGDGTRSMPAHVEEALSALSGESAAAAECRFGGRR